EPIAHANARFTAPARQCPVIAPEWEDPKGVPISAIIFGGRRPSTIPLINESKSWLHGVFMGSITGSEITAAAVDLKVGDIRRDPFAMLPFCGYHMGDYFHHWINLGKKAHDEGKGDKLPKIFFCNWFRKDAEGKFMWPGYGDNSRVLAWIFDRCNGKDNCVETPIGNLPKPGTIEPPAGVSAEVMKELCSADIEGWKKEISDVREKHYAKFGAKLPKELYDELDTMEKNLHG
ncbi:MAG: phosphoenolpyruvate carboxykinase (GTP), partial [Treponema sp.]|nr:phosphoenolpyruvate carboxykinase (GTP) [Treponema sp.]